MDLSLAQQIVLLILGAGVTGAFGMWCIMKAIGYARWAEYSHSEGWYKDRYDRQEQRVLWIKHWANDQMKTIPDQCKTMDRRLLVRYEDLLNVWDKCDRIWLDLGD